MRGMDAGTYIKNYSIILFGPQRPANKMEKYLGMLFASAACVLAIAAPFRVDLVALTDMPKGVWAALLIAVLLIIGVLILALKSAWKIERQNKLAHNAALEMLGELKAGTTDKEISTKLNNLHSTIEGKNTKETTLIITALHTLSQQYIKAI